MEVQHDAGVVFADGLLVIRFDKEGQHRAVGAQRGLDDVRDVVLVRLLVEIAHVDAGDLLVLREVVVRAVGDAPELAPAEREDELEVGRGLGIEAELLGVVVAQTQVLLLHAEAQQPVAAERAPVLEPLEVGVGLAEELQLHLLELTRAEGEVARGDLIAEGLADLADAERQLAPRGALDVQEVHEDALRRFRAQIHGVLRVLGDALEGLEHQVELTDVGEVVLAAGGAGDIVLLDEILHLLLGERVDGLGKLELIGGGPVLDELVGAEALVALAAVHERVGEAAQMARGHPGLRVHEDRRVLADVVGVLLHEFLPPRLFHVVFELDAKRAVVPGVRQAAVDFGAREDKAAVLAERDDLINRFFGVFHHVLSS